MKLAEIHIINYLNEWWVNVKIVKNRFFFALIRGAWHAVHSKSAANLFNNWLHTNLWPYSFQWLSYFELNLI